MSKFHFNFNNNLPHQNNAIESVVELFKGMEKKESNFTIVDIRKEINKGLFDKEELSGISNKISLDYDEISANLEAVQKKRGLTFDKETKKNVIVPRDFTIEMETGTGKTYVYIKTALELSEKYGLKKFIIVVPSVAIREGVNKTFEITKQHFEKHYEPYNVFVYNSSNFTSIKEFATSKNTQIMIINIDAFNKEKKSKIYQPQEATAGNKPIDLIKKTEPIIIIDEPQSVIGQSTAKKPSAGVKGILELNPSMILRYSATHRVRTYDLYKLDAIDAYREGLVKEIVVNSIVVDEDFNEPYMYLVGVDQNKKAAKLRLNVKQKNKYIRKMKTVFVDDDLSIVTGNNVYEGFIIKEIGFQEGNEYLKISNIGENLKLKSNRVFGDTDSDTIKRVQIRETIREHLKKEVENRLVTKERGRVKTLSLFFIDRVANYVDYEDSERVKSGKYAKMFEEEYAKMIKKFIDSESDPRKLKILNELNRQDISKIHDGYFSQDKKTSFVSSYSWNEKESEYKLTTKDEDTFNLIMRDKEKLLDLDNPLRFIFSHSALKEGWDNPNVFQICTLNETKSEIKKRQEIGRGLRLAVDEFGNRLEYDKKVNQLTVMVNESYEEFTEGLQNEYEEIGVKFGVVESDTFVDLILSSGNKLGGEKSIKLFNHLEEKGFLDGKGKLNDDFRKAMNNGEFTLPEELEENKDEIENQLIKMAKTLEVKDGHQKDTVKRSDKVLASPEFIALWNRIKYKTRYEFNIDNDKLISKAVENLSELDVDRLNIISRTANIHIGEEGVSNSDIEITDTTRIYKDRFPNVLFELQNSTNYSRNDIGKILYESGKLDEIKKNPQQFLIEVSKILNRTMTQYLKEEKCVRYIKLGENEAYVQENIFEESVEVFYEHVVETKDKSVYPIYDYDSAIERKFAEELENNKNIIFYTKLPDKFKIDTPIGDYNPDWALVYNFEGQIKVYFVIETKGTKEDMDRRDKENHKIYYAKLHFEELNKHSDDKVDYDVAVTVKDVEKIAVNKKI